MNEPIIERNDIRIFHDPEPQNPREEWDNLGKMVCFHKCYKLGDKPEYDRNDFNSWEELDDQIRKDHGPCTILPLYLLDHSGLCMNTTGFACPWDSGQVGFIYCSEACALKEGVTDVAAILTAEVDTYNSYLQGDVYGFVNENNGDSCWGFYGYEPEELLELVEKGQV